MHRLAVAKTQKLRQRNVEHTNYAKSTAELKRQGGRTNQTFPKHQTHVIAVLIFEFSLYSAFHVALSFQSCVDQHYASQARGDQSKILLSIYRSL